MRAGTSSPSWLRALDAGRVIDTDSLKAGSKREWRESVGAPLSNEVLRTRSWGTRVERGYGAYGRKPLLGPSSGSSILSTNKAKIVEEAGFEPVTPSLRKMLVKTL
jgi:hypothetical protein